VIALRELNALPPREFVAALASIFEHSPWVPEGVAGSRPFPSAVALHEAMCGAVMQADEPQQLALIRAHPELAGRAAIRGDLTSASISEQKGAGLAACTPLEYERLQTLNAAYRERFDFPFVLTVKGHTPQSVIAALERRMTQGRDEERSTALQEICRIARFRLVDLLEEPV
jgi:2-oxo-4-hydroxy-4-carboxy-5-ureidoimidazoline decarboxylase